MARDKRPPLYWKTLRVGLPGLVIGSALLILGGAVLLGVLLLVVGPALFFVPWLLSPYSATARQLAAPTEADLDRSLRFADRLGSIPVLGAVFRFGERISGDAGRIAVEEYRRDLRRREQGED